MRQFQLAAEVRHGTGKGANRRLRKAGYVPAVVYGSGKENVTLQVEEGLLNRLLREGGGNRLITLKLDGEDKAVLMHELQIDPLRGTPQHIDFLEVRLDEEVTVTVQVQLIGEAQRVEDGGVISQPLWEVEVSCLPTEIPEVLEIDVSELVVGDSLQVKDVQVPPGITMVTDPEETVVSVVTPEEIPEEDEVADDVDEDELVEDAEDAEDTEDEEGEAEE
ncbi:MAG: 50S ribosomal protein L25/general stress protein Ctc [Firmicutes bacterium]|nr:50S ribosomal protein L25/general stress protein Ctc [Bacillota bacterium]